jgi:flagellin-like hook-associated protein FlgL
LTGKYLAGRYEVQAGESLQDLIDKVNAGTQSRVGIKLDNTSGRAAAAIMSGAGLAVCAGDEAYVWGDLTRAEGGLATIATFEYLYRVAGLRAGNAENSMFTNNAGLQGLLGWGSAEISTILKNAPDMEAARAELAMIIDRMNNGGLFLSATAGTIAKGYTNATSVQIALDILQAKAGGSVYTSATGQQIFDELMAMGVSFNSAGTMVAFTAANFTFNGVLGNDAGSATVNNLWVNVNDPTQWTTHSALAKLDANNWQAFTFSVADWNSGTATLATIMASAYAHYNIGGAGGFVQAANKNEIIGGGPLQVWGDDSTGVWTTSASIGKALGLSQVSYGGAGGTLQNLGASQNAPVTAGLLLGGAAFDTTDLTTRITSINANVLNSTIGTGVYWNGAYWTDDVALGKALEGNGFEEFRPAWTGDPGSFSDFVSALAPLADMNIKVTADILKNKSQIFFTSASNVTMKRGSVDEQVAGYVDPGKNIYQVGDGTGGYFNAYSLAKAINENKDSQFWAMLDQNDSTVLYVFNKEGGEYNNLLACDVYDVDQMSQKMRSEYVAFENVENTKGMAPGDHRWVSAGTNFTLGSTAAGVWGKMKPILTKETGGNEVWNVVLSGKDVGDARDLWIAAARDIKLPGLFDGYDSIINGLDRHSFVETQDAADGLWAGADVRTQSHAQEALEALNYSIDVKDKIRADLGALQNRLENTMTNLEIQAENLPASESRISDVDVAREMTEFTKNNVLTQAATGMLAQANSLSQLALSLIR